MNMCLKCGAQAIGDTEVCYAHGARDAASHAAWPTVGFAEWLDRQEHYCRHCGQKLTAAEESGEDRVCADCAE